MVNTIKAVIVDDEEDARIVLKSLLNMSDIPVEIIGECPDVLSAVEKIKETKPDVVFLDIEMPNYAGYELVNFFDKIDFEIIFATAYNNFAIKAFEMSAVDYLVKPISRQRLKESLKRIEEKIEYKNTINKYTVLMDNIVSAKPTKLVLPELTGKRVINLENIIYIKGQGSYSNIQLVDGDVIVASKNLKYFESLLPSNENFFRTQKSWIVNLDFVESFNTNTSTIFLKGDNEAKLSKNLESTFLNKIQGN